MLSMRAVPEELTTLISDLETFLSDGLKGETLSKKAKEKREAFIKRIREVKLGFPHDFNKSVEDSDDEEEVESNGGGSLHSERTDREDDDAYTRAQQSPPVAAQDLTSVLKKGYLEKRRKDHSFFGTGWQNRWCVITSHMFYYYSSEKDKQQKGEFGVDGYIVKMNSALRKDSKKDSCFEISAPGKRVYQFCASSPKEAEEWVKQIDFVLKDMTGIIPEEEDDDYVEEDPYDDVGQPIDDDIYEELPDEEEEDMPLPPPPACLPKVDVCTKFVPPLPPAPAVNKSTDYPNYYQGMWDCAADRADELSFRRGDAIYILSKEYQNFGWWVGEMKGAVGIVPKDYLMELYAI